MQNGLKEELVETSLFLSFHHYKDRSPTILQILGFQFPLDLTNMAIDKGLREFYSKMSERAKVVYTIFNELILES